MYTLTRNETYLEAATRCADAIARNYLRPGELQISGGELDDVMVNHHCPDEKGGLCVHGISGGAYGVMALSELVLVGGTQSRNITHVAMVKSVMDWMLAYQWTRDINMGYYNSKARFQGGDFKTVGAAVNGMVRSEITYYVFLAWKATKDPLYLRSLEQTLSWVTYTQYDNMYNEHFYGGGDEGVNVWFQYVNGLGCNFFGETTGQGLGIMEYLLEKEKAPV